MTAFKTNIDPIEHLFAPLTGKALLDIGCGQGKLSRALAKRGATMTGVDAQKAMLDLAQQNAPDATFVQAPGEDLPFEDNTYDGAVMLNSLHRVPEDVIDAGLTEAMRVLKPGGIYLILEPSAEGGYQEVFAPIDDETKIRTVALDKLKAFIDRTGTPVALRAAYETMIPEESAESVLAGGLRVDPNLAARIEEKREEVTQLFAKHVQQTDRGPALDQPMIALALLKR